MRVKLNFTYIILALWLGAVFPSISQQLKQTYPQGYFTFPIKPGQPNTLTGTMGELRSNHFHGGIDVKTDYGQLPVYAAADGYISRIKVSTHGLGNALYIMHPNGLTTVYGHLDHFSSALHQYALVKQYEKQTFELDYYPAKEELPVKQKELIAISGNTGGSGGPHLHFEIRDARENLLNPLFFGFKEIVDTEKPVIEKLAVRSFGTNSRVENEFGRKEYSVVKSTTPGLYTIAKPIKGTGVLGIELKTVDKMNNSPFNYGVACIEMFLDDKEIYDFNIETFSFPENRYINIHMDYQTFVSRKQKFHKCYVADGNQLNAYTRSLGNGKISLQEGKSYKVLLNVYDSYNNKTQLQFTLIASKPAQRFLSSELPVAGSEIDENVLKVTGKVKKDTSAVFYFDAKPSLAFKPTYFKNDIPVYLYDLRLGVPDSVAAAGFNEKFGFIETVYPGVEKEIHCPPFKIKLDDSTLFDTTYFQFKQVKTREGLLVYKIHRHHEANFGRYELQYDHEQCDPKEGLYHHGTALEEADCTEDYLFCKPKHFSNFVIVKDTISPKVTYLKHDGKSVRIAIRDNLSGIASFNAYLDGKWVLMRYEHKNAVIWSEFMDKSQVLKGKFTLEVVDKAGNVAKFEKVF